MPRYYPNNRFSDCYSSVGNITFYHRNGACYYKTKPKPKYPGTPGQIRQLTLHRRAIKAWRELTHDTQLQWNALAKNVKSKQPPFNTCAHISGYNLFVSAYHGLAAIGQEKTPSPTPIHTFPHIPMEYLSSKTINGSDLQITFVSNTPVTTFNNYAIIGKLQITKQHYRPNTGKYRNYTPTISGDANKTLITFTIPQEQKAITPNSIHLKYFIIHKTSGYRTLEQYTTISLKHIVNS